MDLIKQLTGKNPKEYENAAKLLVDNSDAQLFAKLVKQDDFLFDFVKNNVAARIQKVCNKDNYQNLLAFLDYYSPYYDTMIAAVLYEYGGIEILPAMKEIFLNGSESKKAYAAKYFSFVPPKYIEELIPVLRKTARSEFDPLGINSIEVLSKAGDEVSKNEAVEQLKSNDEFQKYDAIRFLVSYQAKDTINDIIAVMKKSPLAGNIASEILYLVPPEELIKSDDGLLVLCNVIDAIPEIIPPTVVSDFGLFDILEELSSRKPTSSEAVLLRLAKDKFGELSSCEEYLFDCDKNTKEEVMAINKLLSGIDEQKLNSYLYEELYEGSDFVLFAVDYADETGELEALLDSPNSTLVLKVLGKLKEKNCLTQTHRDIAFNAVSDEGLRRYIEAL